MSREIRKVCVYCSSSRRTPAGYLEAAGALGRRIAGEGATLVFGGGSTGSMGAVADGALAAGGEVLGITPGFMDDLEWTHQGLTELRVVADLHERKRMMMEEADAVVALPGGCGTFEELLEAITWKRLGLYFDPIVMVNPGGFYDPLVALLERAVAEHLMHERHLEIWSVVEAVDQVWDAIRAAPEWDREARSFATTGGGDGGDGSG